MLMADLARNVLYHRLNERVYSVPTKKNYIYNTLLHTSQDCFKKISQVVYIVGVLAQFLWEAQAQKVSGR